MIVISVPLMKGWVKPNPLYGVRTPKTLADEDVWYRTNARGGRVMFRTGILLLVAVIGLSRVPSLRENFINYNLVCGAVILGGILVGVLTTLRGNDAVPEETDHMPGEGEER